MQRDTKRILLVDDEEDILEFIRYNLEKEGYAVSTATNGKEAIRAAKESMPHLIILDIMMPEMDGIEACKEIRKLPELKQTIIAFLTARNEDYSQIAGFDVGADDYITKPIKPAVLVGRVKALLRRYHSSESDSNSTTVGDIVVDREKYLVYKKGTAISIPKKEFELLSLLISKPGKVFSREEILHKIWGNEIIVGDRTIDVHIRKLREKLGDEYFKTIKGVGYKFDL